MSPMRLFPSLLAVSVIVLIAYPTLAVPVAIAPSHPEPSPIPSGLQGHVRSDAGGSLGGATVEASGAGQSNAARTEPDGSFWMGLGPGTYTVRITAPGHETLNASVIVGASAADEDFTLKHTGNVIQGVVRDAKTGAALAGVVVEAQGDFNCKPDAPCIAESRPMIYLPPTSTVSGSDGKYALGVEPRAYQLRAWKDGFVETWQGVDASEDDVSQDLRLASRPPKSAVLAGKVVDAETGAAVPDAWVSAWPYTRPPEPMPAGGGASGSSGSSTVVADCMAADGSGFAPCEPYPYPEGNSSTTGRDGAFRMNMYPGSYMLSVGAPDYGQFQQEVVLADGQTEDVRVELKPIPEDSVTLKGVVTDKATGKPVVGAWVSVENQQWGAYNGAQTDDQGRFSLRTKPGWTMVWVRHEGMVYPVMARAEPAMAPNETTASPPPGAEPGSDAIAPEPMPPRYQPSEGSYYPWVRGFLLEEDQVQDLRIELQPKPRAELRLVGYVLDADTRKPLAGATVNIRNEDTGDWGYATTDHDGSYVLLVRAGMHTINAYAEGHFGNAVVVSVSGKETRVDLNLEPGQGMHCCWAYAQGGVAYDRAAASEGGAVPPSSAPMAPPSAPQPSAGGAATGAPASSQVGGEGAATYQSAGGLGPYTPPAPGTDTGAGGEVSLKGAPGVGVLAGLAALAAVALLARRKR